MNDAELRGLLEEQLRLSHRLRARIRDLERDRTAPLAVVGMGLRFPGGVTTPAEYAELLSGGSTVTDDIPADRPGLASVYHPEVGTPGCSYVNRAGFLDRVAEFDADFFGISRREAASLDPQQRMLLETAWEAFERAGVAVRRADRLDAGVFVGIMAAEYTERLAAAGTEQVDPYYGTGGGHCFAAGRISYALGLRGPTLSIDTACSSSLVALHAATRSLRARECRYALVGGANLLFSPHLMVSLCQSRALAPDGRSKPFTAAADGYGRGEGVAAVVLMRLDDAVRENRPVLAVLRGVAVNHDGASSGLTVPNGPAQQEVIRAALDDAGTAPGDVSYVEAHGTGTSLGDPIEAGALEAVFGTDHAQASTRLLVSSVKARLGHLEAASGMASLIKVVLMLRRGEILADLPDDDGPLSELIPWRDYHLEVPRRHLGWPGDRRVAGISAFGLSGTNAHAVLSAADPVAPTAPVASPRPELLVLSARGDAALHALAAAVSTHLFRTDPHELASVCHSLRAGRTPFARRLAVVGSTPRELARAVAAAVGEVNPPPSTGAPRRVVLVTRPDAADQLTAAVSALAVDLPLLPDGESADADPAGWLAGALGALGLEVRTRTDVHYPHPAGLEYGEQRVCLVPEATGRATTAFLQALGALFTAGAELDLAPLRVPDARFLPDLPTYPFQRRRFWIDEPHPGRPPTGTAAGAGGTPVGDAAHADDTAHADSADDTADAAHADDTADADAAAGTDPAGAGVTDVAGAGDVADAETVERFLRGELASALGAEGELDMTSSFADLGGDSFTAMLFFKAVEDRYPIGDLAAEFPADRPLAQVIGVLAENITDEIRRTAGVRDAR